VVVVAAVAAAAPLMSIIKIVIGLTGRVMFMTDFILLLKMKNVI